MLSLITVLWGCSCSSDKEKVKLKSEEGIVKYASNIYGKANYVSKETRENSIKYTLEDKEYKFKYTCTSYKANVCIDATCSNIYYEETDCDFDENYRGYIMDRLNLDNEYSNIYIGGSRIFALSYSSEEEALQNVNKVAKELKKIDGRNYFKDYGISIYDNNGQYLGVYDIKSDKYLNKYEEQVSSMTASFAAEVNRNSSDLTGIKYLYYKRVKYKDVEKLQMEWLYKKDVTEDDYTTAYYFKYNGEEYFMLDDKVFIDYSVFNRYISDEYYTSYWFENN